MQVHYTAFAEMEGDPAVCLAEKVAALPLRGQLQEMPLPQNRVLRAQRPREGPRVEGPGEL